MTTLDGVICTLLALVDLVALGPLIRYRRPLLGLLVLASGGLAVGALTLSATGDAFAVMRAEAWLIFVHAPALLLVTAALMARTRPRTAAVCLTAAAALVVVAVDAFWIEPRWLEVARYTIPSDELDRPVRVAVLSDIQTDTVGDYEREVFLQVMAERPDLILLPGDFIQVRLAEYPATAEAFRDLVQILDAPLGVWAVQGNVDGVGWAGDLFAGTAVHAVRHTTTTDIGPLRLTALDFRDGFDPALALPPEPGFHLAFAHGPDFSLSTDVGADLLVAGHTHGGQVQIPFLGPPIVLSRVSRAVGAGGRTELPGGRTLVISRGVGMERGRSPRLRFWCRPQIVVLDLVPTRPASR